MPRAGADAVMDAELLMLVLQRHRTKPGFMHGDLSVNLASFCHTLEDELREVKVKAETAIAAGTYDLGLRDSPTFGLDSIEILAVENFTDVYIHSGSTDQHSAGCPLVGDVIDEYLGTISGGIARGVLARLKAIVVPHLKAGKPAKIEIRNAPGDKYVDTGNPAPAA